MFGYTIEQNGALSLNVCMVGLCLSLNPNPKSGPRVLKSAMSGNGGFRVASGLLLWDFVRTRPLTFHGCGKYLKKNRTRHLGCLVEGVMGLIFGSPEPISSLELVEQVVAFVRGVM